MTPQNDLMICVAANFVRFTPRDSANWPRASMRSHIICPELNRPCWDPVWPAHLLSLVLLAPVITVLHERFALMSNRKCLHTKPDAGCKLQSGGLAKIKFDSGDPWAWGKPVIVHSAAFIQAST